MNKAVGWIFDAYIQDEKAVLWLRTDDGVVLRLTDAYSPSFYLLPRNEDDEKRLFRLLQDSSHIKNVALEEKYVTLEKEKKNLLHIHVDKMFNYGKLAGIVERLYHVEALYNTDLLHIQQYLFTQLGVAPTSKIAIDYTDEKRVTALKRIDDFGEISPPPFTSLLFDLHTDSVRRHPNPRRDSITCLDVRYGQEAHALQGREQAILEQFASLVKKYNPDFLVCPEARKTTTYLFDRVKHLKLDLSLGRESATLENKLKSLRCWHHGRVFLDYGCIENYGIAGLVERSRFSVLPPSIAARWTANRIIDSRNCYELLKRGHVIPKNMGGYAYIRTVEEVVNQDRGGLLLAPEMGVVHENVAELDFESEYPHLIVHDGLSYETVTPQGLSTRDDALLPHVTKQILDRRLWFKRLRRRYDEDSPEWRWCEQRQLSLKMILVCLYGTSGCCWNRFGNVLCFEEINRRSRETLIKTKNFVQQRGFDIVYADTDSLFVKKKYATQDAYEALSRAIRQLTGLPIALDHHYKFFLLLPRQSRSSLNMEAQKHYLGVLTNGNPLTRGIENRRHDCPRFIKKFQNKLIQILFDAETVADVYAGGYTRAVNFVVETVDRIMKAKIPPEELVISKTLRKPLSEYTSLFPHVSAAVSLAQQDVAIRKGDVIDFIYVNARHRNPLRRVAPLRIYASSYYDQEKYRSLVLDAAETVLSVFGFAKQKFDVRPRGRFIQETLFKM